MRLQFATAVLALTLSVVQASSQEAVFNEAARSNIALAADACARFFLKGESPASLEAKGFSPSGARGWLARSRNENSLGRQSVSLQLDRKGGCHLNTSHSGNREAQELGSIALERVRTAGFREAKGARINNYLVKVHLVAGKVKLDYRGGTRNSGAPYAFFSLTPME